MMSNIVLQYEVIRIVYFDLIKLGFSSDKNINKQLSHWILTNIPDPLLWHNLKS